MIWTCDECKAEHTLVASLKRRATGYKNIYSVGLFCGQCGFWTHSFFTSAALEKKRQKVDKQKALYQHFASSQSGPIASRQHTDRVGQLFRDYQRLQRSFQKEFEDYQKRLVHRIQLPPQLQDGEMVYDVQQGSIT